MGNARLNEAQAAIKITRRNINNLRYTDDATVMAESEEELKNLLMKVKKESEKAGLNLNIKETKIMASSPITSWQIEGWGWGGGREEWKPVTDFLFLGSKIIANGDHSHEIKRCYTWQAWEPAVTNTDDSISFSAEPIIMSGHAFSDTSGIGGHTGY